ncbi:MAG: TraB/GumN family protein [Alphaproteobacteria bacterium]|nr:MAG: TraB/GumN family protein [Alphaproteobacteria bacterium]
MRKKLTRALLALSAAGFAASGCGAEPPVQANASATAMATIDAKPAVWKLSDADTTIYLFGSIHLLPEGVAWQTAPVKKALGASKELVLETVLPEDQMVAAQAMMKLGISPNLPPLSERVPPEKRAVLASTIAESGLPPVFLDKLETWAAALALLQVSFKRLGLDPARGVESQLTADFKTAGKPVSGLEGFEEQLGFIDGLSEEAQRVFLNAALDDPAQTKLEFAKMLDAWTRGDVAGIAKSFDSETMLSGELRTALMVKRNANWTKWIEARMAKPGAVFIAVGAGHLAGADSVIAMLAKDGVKAERVE